MSIYVSVYKCVFVYLHECICFGMYMCLCLYVHEYEGVCMGRLAHLVSPTVYNLKSL